MTTWKTRLAQSRNANDESEVDESLLNTGLFTYPVLQAADVLLYKSVLKIPHMGIPTSADGMELQSDARPRRRRPNSTHRALPGHC